MTSTSSRTRNGCLQIPDPTDPDRFLTIAPGAAGIRFHTVDRDTDQRVSVYLDTEGLNELAAEVLRIREEKDI